jgi:hypothetical protein
MKTYEKVWLKLKVDYLGREGDCWEENGETRERVKMIKVYYTHRKMS